MLLLLCLLGLALDAVCPPDDPPFQLQRGQCPTSWYSFNEIHCVSNGANLVSIQRLENLMKTFDPAEGRTRFGLSDSHREGCGLMDRVPDNNHGREKKGNHIYCHNMSDIQGI
uniref:Uncharacterized protein n=1 Tax=Gasterosteus aculeatus aculeatus TaxID=481459 RepID=A0AAQ4QGB9_GASAC